MVVGGLLSRKYKYLPTCNFSLLSLQTAPTVQDRSCEMRLEYVPTPRLTYNLLATDHRECKATHQRMTVLPSELHQNSAERPSLGHQLHPRSSTSLHSPCRCLECLASKLPATTPQAHLIHLPTNAYEESLGSVVYTICALCRASRRKRPDHTKDSCPSLTDRISGAAWEMHRRLDLHRRQFSNSSLLAWSNPQRRDGPDAQ